ncbi:hypothetical protein ASPVEDRAFT_315774 [Aspergillus versicolor CBS 583.65]|uniref:F-box domain-containing protein n=1 Tax=Aspergillus versicolor CBS 583.65 TaxID=1036611 RepID=A0A1L9PXJ4_ASPVE|nr:uncharacterized protein ASPVEDRAFT_315774 [Aspergillus versicolor CBS 583.65]OJJ06237.1 hypothetical protein ASPVEDRAFT_315774 [Aspergillus versicolor CBS 583.65]
MGWPVSSLKFPRLWGLKSPPASPRQPSRLEILPPELLLCIKDCLEKPDIVCLSLCSHHLLDVIGKRCLSLTDGDNQLKPAILMRVDRDLPHLFYCPYCTKLHRIKDIPHPTLRSKKIRRPCPDMGLPFSRGLYIPENLWTFLGGRFSPMLYAFRHCHLAAVMKNHYHGYRHTPQGLTVKWLSYMAVENSVLDRAITTLLSVEGRVCSLEQNCSTLVLQTQQWVLFHDTPGIQDIFKRLGWVFICRHKEMGSLNVSEVCDVCSTIPSWHAYEPEYLCCPRCRNESQIKIRDCGTDGTAVVITKWLDMGAGLDINDPKWQQKITCDISGCGWETKGSGDLSRLFRDAADPAQRDNTDPTDRNQAYLVRRQRRRHFLPGCSQN